MISQVIDGLEQAVSDVADGAVVMIGGFGRAGQPVELIDALLAQGATDLTVINNNAGNGDTDLAALLAARRVARMICSFPARATRMSSTRCTARVTSSSNWCRRAISPNASVPPVRVSAPSTLRRATARRSPRARRRERSTAGREVYVMTDAVVAAFGDNTVEELRVATGLDPIDATETDDGKHA